MIINTENLIWKIILFIALIILGFIIAKIISYSLNKFFKRAEVEKALSKNFVDLFINVVKWSIILLFINFSINTLNIPFLINFITPILTIIPAFVGGLILIGLGFIIALYLKEVIEESKIKEKDIFSKIIFYFVLYVFIIFSFKTVMINQDKNLVNQLILIISVISACGITFWYAKKKKQ